MVLRINGEDQTVPPVANVMELLRHLRVGEERVAVELNRRIVRRQEWGSAELRDRDQIEIVQFVGGG
jgi:thiamine biosynthesis protein ThiS